MTLDAVQRYVVGVLKGWFTNKAVVDKLEEDSEGMLLFNGQKIDSKKEVYMGTSAPKDPAMSIWLDTSTQPATLKRRTSLDTFDIVASMSVDTLGIANIEYSEEEKVVGCWIDGKPIYRRITDNSLVLIKEDFSPGMTSATSPSPYAVTESSCGAYNYAGWYAFDTKRYGNGSTYWSCSPSNLPAWVMIDMGSPTTVEAATLYCIDSSYSNRNPKEFEFQGSNDGNIFDTLLAVTNDDVGPGSKKYKFSKIGKYRYYRLYVTKNCGGEWLSVDMITLDINDICDDCIDVVIRNEKIGTKYITEYTKITDEPGSFDPNMLGTIALESLATDDEVNAVTWNE